MANDWIKMRSALQTHPKVVRIMSALEADRLRVIGGLHAVWCLFDTHSEDGKLHGYTAEIIDTLIGWAGFARAMLGVSWLEENEGSLVAPRFDEHNGQSAKRRAEDAERKRNVRKMSAKCPQPKRTKSGPEKEKEKESIKTEVNTVNEEFEFAWKQYPKRPGANKRDTLKAWLARIASGASSEEMTQGIIRYAAYCKESNQDPKYIKQPATFVGPDKHYLSDWSYQQRSNDGKQSRFDKLAEVSAALTGRTKKDNARTFDGSAERLD